MKGGPSGSSQLLSLFIRLERIVPQLRAACQECCFRFLHLTRRVKLTKPLIPESKDKNRIKTIEIDRRVN